MSPHLHPTIAAYFAAANAHDVPALASCFIPDAVVEDEDRECRGRDAIRAWKEDALGKYRPVHEPLSSEQEGHVAIVVSRVSGEFPGSPVDLLHEFVLEGNAIRRLSIRLA